MAAHNDFGALAERLAAAMLERNGWTILHRNWRFGRLEIDLVARRGDTVAFVEVKAGARATHGHPLDRIGWRKRRDLGIAAAAWVRRHGRHRYAYRFDAVHVLPGRPGGLASGADWEVVHTEQAWSM
jgi:putative endonuclease